MKIPSIVLFIFLIAASLLLIFNQRTITLMKTTGKILSGVHEWDGKIECNENEQTCDANSEPIFTAEKLRLFNGIKSPSNPKGKIYLSVGGVVFDVSSGKQFYAPGRAYHLFAGRTVSRSLTLGTLEDGDLEHGDLIDDFTEAQLKELRKQVDFYTEK
jgi:membrane-associated progesterone receptor component